MPLRPVLVLRPTLTFRAVPLPRPVLLLRPLVVLGGVVAGLLLTGAPAGAGPEWRWPVDGAPVVTRRFDPPATPYGPGHRGVDLAAAPGAVVRTAGSGVVSYAGVLAGRGVVVVRHGGGLRTTYEPVVATVAVGQPVRAGDALGGIVAGHRGCPAPACLHWGLVQGRHYLDPLSLLGAGQVRLLPLDRPTAIGWQGHARGWACWYTCRRRSALTWV